MPVNYYHKLNSLLFKVHEVIISRHVINYYSDTVYFQLSD